MEKQYITQVINSYIDAYNKFDVVGMLATLHPQIRFENISNGITDLNVNGLTDFERQAQTALQYFSERKQLISDISISGQTAEVSIDYEAVLAIDLPNGLKAGESLRRKGQSIFGFKDNLIISLTDIS